MAIVVTKAFATTPPEEFNLYCKTTSVFFNDTLVVVDVKVYKSAEHYTDSFLPVILKNHTINDAGVVGSFNSNYYTNPTTAIASAENWLVTNDAWYSGGSVIA